MRSIDVTTRKALANIRLIYAQLIKVIRPSGHPPNNIYTLITRMAVVAVECSETACSVWFTCINKMFAVVVRCVSLPTRRHWALLGDRQFNANILLA